MPIALSDRRVFQAFNFEVHYSLADNDTFSATQLKTRVCLEQECIKNSKQLIGHFYFSGKENDR